MTHGKLNRNLQGTIGTVGETRKETRRGDWARFKECEPPEKVIKKRCT